VGLGLIGVVGPGDVCARHVRTLGVSLPAAQVRSFPTDPRPTRRVRSRPERILGDVEQSPATLRDLRSRLDASPELALWIVDVPDSLTPIRFDVASRALDTAAALFIESTATRLWVIPQARGHIGAPCYVCFELRRLACRADFPAQLLGARDDARTDPERLEILSRTLAERLSELVSQCASDRGTRPWWAAALEFDVTSGERVHWFARHPSCPVCSAREVAPRQERVPGQRPVLISPVCGLISTLRTHEFASSHVAIARASNPNLAVGQSRLDGLGCASRAEQARLAAIGEAVELYTCLAWRPPEPVSGIDRSDQGVIPAGAFLGDARDREPEDRNDPRARPHTWVRARSLTDGADRFVPMEAVSLEAKVGLWRSLHAVSGIAAHVRPDASIRNALLEVIERDAFMATWVGRLRVEAFDVRSHPDENVRRTAARLEASGLKLHLQRLPAAEAAEVFIGVLIAERREEARPRVAVGLGCSLDVAGAARRAVFEVTSVFRELARRMADPSVRAFAEANLSEAAGIRALGHHGLFYATREDVAPLDFLIEAGAAGRFPTRERRDYRGDLSELIHRVKSSGHQVLYVDMTLPEVFHAGWRVSRLLIPGYLPLTIGASHVVEAMPRLRSLLARAEGGFERALNAYPHPLA
jgi:ribosomal protein S12 methylthiotransferase accessory factor